MWHKIQHYFGWNLGSVVHFQKNGIQWVAFMCNGCGNLSGITKSIFQPIGHDHKEG